MASAAIRERADAARRLSCEELRLNRWRELRWWWEQDGDRLALWGSLRPDWTPYQPRPTPVALRN